jgi:hypothetical protein
MLIDFQQHYTPPELLTQNAPAVRQKMCARRGNGATLL